jgi:[acyl-carrier-protein] S-malonyltransferase
MLAILCSGQGRQQDGMFALTGDAPEAAGLFDHAKGLLGGHDPRELVRDADSATLHHNRVGQILCTLQALAAAAALRAALPSRLVVVGYSVGEVASWGVAGVLDGTTTLDLIAQRAEAMDAASPAGDGLLFLRGLGRDAVAGLCARHAAEIAIVEPGDAVIVGGNRARLQALAVEATAMGAGRAIAVPVEVASHTSRLAAASSVFRARLKRVSLRLPPPPGIRLLSGIDGTAVLDAASGIDRLAAQISQPVQWAACLQACIEAGATAFLELGPGPALSGMAGGAYPDVAARSLDDFRTLDGVKNWLARESGR